ncbi:hypothetical protein NLJ89_g9045 [Agrocybe chaxingu]|uniref:Uncharacterized protein n=1 Tax=Agrocybe chaxingu TaxID=84603 RepID=A0A9W8JWH4_9AGAR|nr:hypothetical protein NLJ89_g9045 [Agrocybe chaxingu]
MSASASTNSPRRSSRLSKGTSLVPKNQTTSATQLRPKSQVKKSKAQRLPTANVESPQTLYFRINRKFLCLLSAPTADKPDPPPLPPPGTTGNLNVIIANLPDLRPFAGDTVNWLIKVARLIFEPLGASSLYTFATESLEWWLGREMDASQWRKRTLSTRLGDLGIKSIVEHFSPSSTVVDIYDPTIGILLLSTLDSYADVFKLGFWNTGPNQYTLHSFSDQPHNFCGGPPLLDQPVLHGYQITRNTHDPWLSLPPAGVFGWHYIQCILKKFATPTYRQIPNIDHYSLPIRTKDDEDDSDIDFDDERNIENPPYPSYFWDLAASKAHQYLEAQERDSAIAKWTSGVE